MLQGYHITCHEETVYRGEEGGIVWCPVTAFTDISADLKTS